MSDSINRLSFSIKELCYFCYVKNLRFTLKLNIFKKCENPDCGRNKAIYVNPKNTDEFVRDFQNGHSGSTSVKKCDCKIIDKFGHMEKCTFAINKFELYVWDQMKTLNIFKISEIFTKYIEPYVFIPTKELNPQTLCNAAFTKMILPNKINHIPSTPTENHLVINEEKKKCYFCWFCMNEVVSEHEIPTHINGKKHRQYYEADKKRRWYFKMPVSESIVRCSTENEPCDCSLPHSEDEFQEMIARVKFRKFMISYSGPPIQKQGSSCLENITILLPKFPSNIKCYKIPITIPVSLNISKIKCEKITIYLRDDESRPFFKLIKMMDNQILNVAYKNQQMTMNFDENCHEIIFGVELNPLYSSTFCQTIEFTFENADKTFTCTKEIRADVGTTKHLGMFSKLWKKYGNIISRPINIKSFLPFNKNEIHRRGILNEEILKDVIKVIPNLEWINTTVQNYNYIGWISDMNVLEELEQRLLLSRLQYSGEMTVRNWIESVKDTIFAQDGKLFGILKYDPDDDYIARALIMKNVTNCYLIFSRYSLSSVLFECELIDTFRYDNETRGSDGFCVCLSKETLETVKLKNGENVDVQIYFCFDRLVFDRRFESLKNIPTDDKLSYNPLVCPSITRLPYGDAESTVTYNEFKQLNDEQKKMPRLILRKLKDNEIPLPFILNGAFGTGKSLVFAETLINILKKDKNARSLVCTRSYSANQVYIDIFNESIPSQMNAIKNLVSDHREKRNLPRKEIVYNKYLTEEKLSSNKIFITTLENAVDCLAKFNSFIKEKSLFKYIFIDEAAQVLEIDAIMVYQFGNLNTKFIFAGDIRQSRPELYNRALKKFSVPIICRLYSHYKDMPNYTIYLTEVYRTHPKIVEFLSKTIYQQTLISSMIPKYPELVPMLFIDSSENDIKEEFDKNYWSFKNAGECNLVVSEINNLLEQTEISIKHDRILVCTPFDEQVKLIRISLRCVGLGGVTVEKPSNIQGKEFDAVFISTVLSKAPQHPISIPTFHSSKNLINLVISRAIHFVAVIGHKPSLTSNTPTEGVWKAFIEMCDEFYDE